jgi:hypothetical protein
MICQGPDQEYIGRDRPAENLFGFGNGRLEELSNSKHFSGSLSKDKDYTDSAEPLRMLRTVSKGDTIPVFTAHGDRDVEVTVEKTKIFSHELADNNVDHKLVVVPAGEHHYGGPDGCWDKPLEEAFEFIAKYI